MRTLNHDEIGPAYGWDGDKLTVLYPTPADVFTARQIRLEEDLAWDLYRKDAA
jgi:hypothetical protein